MHQRRAAGGVAGIEEIALALRVGGQLGVTPTHGFIVTGDGATSGGE
jgi:hypothetical protein